MVRHPKIKDVSLICASDPGYREFLARAIAERKKQRQRTWGGPGRRIGQAVERAVLKYLSKDLVFLATRILTWKEWNGRTYVRKYRELDGVVKVDRCHIVVYEVKCCGYAAILERATGYSQLWETSALLALAYPNVSRRLVYVSDAPVKGFTAMPTVDILDTSSPAGVMWIKPRSVEIAAKKCSIDLPRGWYLPEVRAGSLRLDESGYWTGTLTSVVLKPGQATKTAMATAFRAALLG